MIKKIIFTGILAQAFFLFASCGPAAVESGAVFESGENCTAYRVGKRMFLFKEVTVIGKNCSSTASVISADGSVVIKVSLPVSGFKSGEDKRDEHTAAILGAPAVTEIEFVSATVPAADWEQAITGKTIPVKGTLKVKGKESPIETNVQFTAKDKGYTASGSLQTTFSVLGLEAPKVAGGLVATVNDALELHFQFQSDKIK
jgi:hypothetical protein